MRFSLIPREMRFFDMFDETAANLNIAANKFLEMVTVFDKLDIRSHELKREEDACDNSVEKIIKALDRTFITPFDREDIHTLATSLDDVMDNMEETSHRLEVFRIERPTPEAIELARIIKECCLRLEAAIKLLRDMRNSERIHVLLREIGQLENDADKVYRKTDAALFANLVTSSSNGDHPITALDILTLIKWRELYGWLEETVDACKEVANVISEIVIKGT
ncbi:MAG: DUF47 family protein [Planctomycetes bacterium]|jgi:uncharacterized protein Yka (UPF0111/DUF47 family)|nr:DUF47 family protein [Planctomycetota bacterium]